MGTTGINVSLTNKDWGLIEVTGLEYYSKEWQFGPEPFRDTHAKLRHGESEKHHLEAYNGHNGYRFTLTVKLDGAWTFKILVDPITAYEETYLKLKQRSKVYSVTDFDGDNKAPPTVYALLSGEGSDRNIEFVVARQHDGILADSGELACTPAEQSCYRAWLREKPVDYYQHYNFHGIPLASDPPDDRFDAFYNLRRFASDSQLAKLAADTGRWRTTNSDTFFNYLDLPKGADPRLYTDDEWFGNFPLFGPDPTMIERVERDDQLPQLLRDKIPQLVHVGKLPPDFESALANKQLYRVDYSRYAHLTSGTGGRFACWPTALFIRRSYRGGDGFEHGKLLPVAIELNFPHDGPQLAYAANNTNQVWPWETAKRLFLCAAANYHELGAHLGRCHFVMERYALATYRKLPPNHPVGRLLRPHFKFLVATDHQAVTELINPGGPVDRNFMVGIEDSLKVTADAFSSWDLRVHGNIENDLRRRGVEDLSAGPRDWIYNQYGRRIYRAIHSIVQSYLRLWYGADDQKVQTDLALRTWNDALRGEYGAGEHAVPLPSDAFTLDSLVTACTNIIWTSGPQHSAVNYPQYDFLADAKTLPFANYLTSTRPYFMAKLGHDPESRARIEDQAQVTTVLAAFRFDKLGHYLEDASGVSEYGDLGHPHVPWAPVIANFPLALADVTKYYFSSPNLWGYPYLLPGNITNGISI
jgi:arachidonate 15-lipoxygenase